MLWVRISPEQLFFCWERDVQVCCVALALIGLTVPMYANEVCGHSCVSCVMCYIGMTVVDLVLVLMFTCSTVCYALCIIGEWGKS